MIIEDECMIPLCANYNNEESLNVCPIKYNFVSQRMLNVQVLTNQMFKQKEF